MPRKVIKVDSIEGLDIYLAERQIQETGTIKEKDKPTVSQTEKPNEFKRIKLE